jgi:hypothetical protein
MSFEVWDPQDKGNGKLKHICDGINDLNLSIPSFNKIACSNSPPTHTLAIEMLTDPAKFFIEISDEALHIVAAYAQHFFIVT